MAKRDALRNDLAYIFSADICDLSQEMHFLA